MELVSAESERDVSGAAATFTGPMAKPAPANPAMGAAAMRLMKFRLSMFIPSNDVDGGYPPRALTMRGIDGAETTWQALAH